MRESKDKTMEFITYSPEETMAVGGKLAGYLNKGDIILLNGTLGAGKTHFVKGLAKGLGIADHVTSPTFTIENIYRGTDYTLNHFDVYRVNDEAEILDLGFEEAIYSDAISVIEWSDLIPGILPNEFIRVDITADGVDEGKRTIRIAWSKGQNFAKEGL